MNNPRVLARPSLAAPPAALFSTFIVPLSAHAPFGISKGLFEFTLPFNAGEVANAQTDFYGMCTLIIRLRDSNVAATFTVGGD